MKINKKTASLIILLLIVLAVFTGFNAKVLPKVLKEIKNFVSQTEAKTFDIRQNTLSKTRKPSKDIVVVGIDNVSHEYLTSYFGSWPLPRSVYADFIEYTELQNPAAIGVDVLFVGSWHKNKQNDILLADTFKKYDNVFGAIYFDDYTLESRVPLLLPESAKASVKSNSKITPYVYKNLRELYPEFLQSAKNLGHLNLERSGDGVIRTLPLFAVYKDSYYPNFALKIFTKYEEQKFGIDAKDYSIDRKRNLVLGTKKIPVTQTTESVLNWYEINPAIRDSSFEFVSFKEVFESMNAEKSGQTPKIKRDFFKDKVVLLGFTADSLADLKTVPTTKLLPGVEIYATFISNAIDGTSIKKTGTAFNFVLILSLFLLLFALLMRIENTWINLCTTAALAVIYTWFSFVVMKYFYLWIPLAAPLMVIVFTYAAVMVVKYFLKSEDYEHVYKLATNDSLTNLYNHRFFQDQMKINLEYCKRYGGTFSLILIDIDKFKTFNDTYGHLVGDEVLRQVSKLLKDSVRKADIVCRYGGEEITVILPHTSNPNAYRLAKKLCKLISGHKFVVSKDLTVNVTISLGVSSYPDSAKTVQELIELADKNMYNAKQNGRNRVGSPDGV